MFDNFFASIFAGPAAELRRNARSLARQWGKVAFQLGTESDPSAWERWQRTRGAFFEVLKSYFEATLDQAFPHLAEYECEYWEYVTNVFPPPADMLLGDRIERLKAWCQTMMGARPEDIEAAIENLTGVGNVHILEHSAAQCAEDPTRVYDFWTLLPTGTLEDEDTRNDINEIVRRWKPGHTSHGASKGTGSGAGNPYGGCREADPSDISTPAPFKTGSGSEKTGRNLIHL